MIGDRGRGWAWTRAILGLQADEIHLCGEAGAINLIEEICNTTGEEIEVSYQISSISSRISLKYEYLVEFLRTNLETSVSAKYY